MTCLTNLIQQKHEISTKPQRFPRFACCTVFAGMFKLKLDELQTCVNSCFQQREPFD